MKHPYCKQDGERTLFHLLIVIRDCRRFTGASRELMDALAMRAVPDQKTKGDLWRSWPDYGLLVKDTQRNIRTLKRAAADLEELKVIRRVERRNDSNLCFLNFKLMEGWAMQIPVEEDPDDPRKIEPPEPEPETLLGVESRLEPQAKEDIDNAVDIFPGLIWS
jgi:hypothetical protein